MTRKGFTLIEVLIVVVIIAVLAALILPRFMGQSERAKIAEAQQMLGAMRRGQMRWQDMTGAGAGVTLPIHTCGAGTPCLDEEWAALGVTPPPLDSDFSYFCTSSAPNAECGAARVSSNNDYNDAEIDLNIATGDFTCVQGMATKGYTAASATDPKRGCTAVQ